MGRTGIPPNITRAECERVLDIIQKDYELRRKEHEQLSKIQEEVNEHAAQRDVLSKRKEFNEKYCILCCSSFNLLFRRKIECEDCHFRVCRACAFWENNSKVWICTVCEKQRFIDAESNTWFYNRIKQRFKLFGAAKVLETHCRKRRTSDSENDSGYGHPSDFKPLLSLFSCSSSHSISSMAETSALEEEDVDDEDAEIHQSVESVVEGLLGCSLDDASVDHMYTHNLYDDIFFLYHGQLVVAVKNLTGALQKSRNDSSVTENECSPTATHTSLKMLISDIVRECQNLPDLQLSDCNGWRDHTENFKVKDSEIFSSYDSLVAAAIINKIVEEAQMKYVRTRGSFPQESTDSKKDMSSNSVSSEKQRSSSNGETCEVSADEDFSYIKIPVECVQVEEIEEITREYTDSEDDKFSSISHQSSGLQSTDDLGIFREDSEISFPGISEVPDDGKIPFPEFGRDLVDDADSLEDKIICHPTAVTSWEENWLFRKKKRLPLYSNLKYQLLTYCDEPPHMLIPCPSEGEQPEDSLEQDELSELSESHSVGSLEFSSESEQNLKPGQNSPLDHVEKVQYNVSESDDDIAHAHPNVPIMYQENGVTSTPEVDSHQRDVCSRSHITLNNKQQQEDNSEITPQEEMPSLHLEDKPPCIEEGLKPTNDNLFDVPTLPGSIAEREHQKWLNAVPLKNNPYSAENISKRLGKSPKTILKDHASSFEEFEKELLDSSDVLSEKVHENKLDCGLKSIDVNLYKRDYYVNGSKTNGFPNERMQEETLSSLEGLNDANHDLIPDETLNSLEEKVYISSGKVFTLENHFKRLERELKDISLSSNDLSSLQLTSQQSSQMENLKNQTVDSTSEDERSCASLPSVKVLATKFIPSSTTKYMKHSDSKKNLSTEKRDLPQMKEEGEKVKKSKPCMKVHSLTARSLSREFRVMARQNIPRPMNRTVSVRPPNSEDTLSERDCISPVSVPSPVCGSGVSANPDLAHGYTSDESSTSTNSLPRPKARRHISRSILQRASYWERRAEQGLLSDASVNEEFPAIDITPD